MSHDQKPKAVRAVTSGDGSGATSAHDGIAGAEAGTDAPARPRGSPVVPAVLFLIGCACGGAAFVAAPHYLP